MPPDPLARPNLGTSTTLIRCHILSQVKILREIAVKKLNSFILHKVAGVLRFLEFSVFQPSVSSKYKMEDVRNRRAPTFTWPPSE